MNQYFYCYSDKLFHFIKAFGMNYLYIGANKNTNQKYHVFEKSERLDNIIALYNNVKHSI